MKLVLVTGSREFSDKSIIDEALTAANPDCIIQGDAEGADFLCKHWAIEHGVSHLDRPANWKRNCEHFQCRHKTFCVFAGFIRNIEMVQEAVRLRDTRHLELVCLAFLKKGARNRGTRDCIFKASNAGIRIKKYEQG